MMSHLIGGIELVRAAWVSLGFKRQRVVTEGELLRVSLARWAEQRKEVIENRAAEIFEKEGNEALLEQYEQVWLGLQARNLFVRPEESGKNVAFAKAAIEWVDDEPELPSGEHVREVLSAVRLF